MASSNFSSVASPAGRSVRHQPSGRLHNRTQLATNANVDLNDDR
jgi:hypothetical protein